MIEAPDSTGNPLADRMYAAAMEAKTDMDKIEVASAALCISEQAMAYYPDHVVTMFQATQRDHIAEIRKKRGIVTDAHADDTRVPGGADQEP